MNKKEDTEKIMQILEKYYKKAERTTLNIMRRKISGKKSDAFKILISCLISLRTRDENTEKVVKKLFKFVKKPEDLIKIPRKKLEKLIFSSGYYKNKAKTLKHVSSVILKKYKGKVPQKKEELLGIKGIGPKTANIVLAFAFNKIVIPVDVNVHRIANRLGWAKTKIAEKTEEELEKILPRKFWREINSLFILHGRNICLPISPKCSICPVNKYCKRVGVRKNR